MRKKSRFLILICITFLLSILIISGCSMKDNIFTDNLEEIENGDNSVTETVDTITEIGPLE